MPDAASIPRPEKEALEERVRRLAGRTVDQVWYREIERTGPEGERPEHLPLWQQGEDFERVFMDFYLATDEDLFRLTWGLEPKYGGYASRNPASVDLESEDLSEKEPWSVLVGQRISGVRYYWRWHEGGGNAPASRAIWGLRGRTATGSTSRRRTPANTRRT